ncbi:hypothetical protein [Pontibacter akesuensis]|uniref:Uncharacterized protein n=1 Tax=Pontibacter akesuensis TaxID=388950 RepID=A0A1I7GEA4_9BACT|nr:hypothetical protein [Pontibacter akesuensis]GHA57312.1 hypothetical protein GCM10007389_06260 [Pontibacter akesuensis]SFU46651.1 hypothetical protein SAMN04487941_0943 [Pontibacter akesuensis]
MNNMLKYSALLLVLVLVLAGCRKEPNYSDIPQITFDRVEQYTYSQNKVLIDTLFIVIDFQDGDGNLGLSRGSGGSQTGPDFQDPFNPGSPYFDNYFANLQVKRGNTYESTPFTFSGRFPRLSNDEAPETLEGEIRFTIDSFTTIDYPAGDTVRFEVYIYDRALNKSNVVYTDDVVLYQGQGR